MARLEVDIVANLEKLFKQLGEAEKSLQGFATKAIVAGGALTASITVPIIALGKASIKTFGEIEALKKGLIAVSKSAKDAEDEFSKLIEVAKLPGLGLEEAVRGSVSLQSAGFSADEARKALLAFGNALATVGKGKNELNFVILALTQLQNKTTGFGQDLRQLTEQLPQLRGALTAAFGTSDSEAIAKLGVTGREVVDLLVTEFEKLPKVTGGVKNAFENFGDSATNSLARVGESLNQIFDIEGKIEGVAASIESISTAFSELDSSTKTIIITVAALAAGIGPLLLGIGSIIKLLPVLKAGLISLSGPFGIIAIAIAASIPLLINLNEELKKTAKIAGQVKAELLEDSIKASREEFERLSKSLESTGLKPLEAQNRAIDLLIKQETELLKSRLTGSRVDADASKARIKDLMALRAELNKVVKTTAQTLEEFSKIADLENDKLFTRWAFEADRFNKKLEETEKYLSKINDVSTKISEKISKVNPLSGIIENDVGLGGSAPVQEKAKENPFDSLFKAVEDTETLVTAFKSVEDQFKAFSGSFAQTVVDFTLNIKDIIKINLGEAFVGIGDAIGQALATGESVISAIGKSLLKSIATFLGDLGQQLIAFGIAGIAFGALMEAISKGGPLAIPAGIAAIAAGVALVAISSAIRSSAAKGVGGGGSGGGGNVSTGGAGSSFAGSGIEPYGYNDINLTSTIRGSDIVLSVERTQNKENNG